MRALIACLFGLLLLRTCAAIAKAAEANQPPWVRIEAGTAFSFEAPEGIRKVRLQGIDSFVGGYVSDQFTIGFDYGYYSNSLQGVASWEKIDGRPSKFESGGSPECSSFPGDDLQGTLVARVYVVRQQSPKIALMMEGCARNEEGLQELQRLFRSIRFGPN